jgi:hypothetical protein
MAGILAGAHGKQLSTPWYDNLVVKAAGAAQPAVSPPLSGRKPLYGNQKPVR